MTDTPPATTPPPADPAEMETLAMVAKAAADKAVAAVDTPTWKPATVLEVVGNIATVHVDGDPPDVTIQAEILASPTPYPDARVMVKFQPPSGAFVESWITRADPAGEIKMFARTEAPPGFLVCNGGAYLRSVYTALFEAIGTRYGAGDGSTTFNVPNLADRVIVAAGGSYAVGARGGAGTLVLVTANLPSHVHNLGGHTHPIAHTHDMGSHAHSFSGSASSSGSHQHTQATDYRSDAAHRHFGRGSTSSEGIESPSGTTSVPTSWSADHTHPVSGTVASQNLGSTGGASSASQGATADTAPAGSGTSISMMQPYEAMLACISI